ncbi:MAG: glycosyltransferase family 4 protein [Candidatus Pacebacteria bacterium]|nr:glycosyltransferase family 4 protein [Candidatus Paceibacterota bacterium]
MKLLILTQKVDKNDDILGFFHGWIAKFAKYCEKVTVVALGTGLPCEISQSDNFSKRKTISQGNYDLPQNVKVLSLGKESTSQKSKVHKVKSRQKYIFNFYKYIWRERKNYDTVFVHMNPEYVVLGGLFWKIWRKEIGLWYLHKAVNLKLRMAEKLADIIFSATPESFRLQTKKLKITGHGIDLNKYNCEAGRQNKFDVLCVGRISPIKNQKLLIEAVDILVNQKNQENLKAVFVGGASSDKDRIYREELRKLVKNKKLEKNIFFEGAVPNTEIVRYYCGAKLSVNLCPTGGADKVVLEAMACELPVIVLNKTFQNILPREFILKNADPKELAEKIVKISNENKPQTELRREIIKRHGLNNLIKNIINSYYA